MSNVPKLRFSEFSGEWEDKKFGDIYTFLQTNSFSRALLNYDSGEVKNIHYGDIHTKFKSNFYIQNEKVPFINIDIDITNIKDENYCQEKDLVIADASEDYKDIGKAIELINLNNEKLLAGLHTYIARDVKDKMALGFSGYLMQIHNIRLQMMKFATGISVLGVSKGNLLKLKLNLPQKQEQEKIASFLTSIDKKIEQLTKKETLLQEYKKGVMNKIFNQEIRFKDDDGSEFPEWEEKKLGELPIIISDGNYGEMYPTSKDFKSNGVAFLRANNIKNLKIDDSDTKYITKEQHSILTSGHLQTNDILITTRGDLGNIALVDYKHNGSNINAQICLLRVSDISKLNYLYLLFVLDYRDSKIQYKAFETGTALKQLPKGNLRKLMLKLPCLEEQTKIANFLSSIDKKIELTTKELNSTKEFKKALLQQMFV